MEPGTHSLLHASVTDSLLIMHLNTDTPMIFFSWNATQNRMKYSFMLAGCATAKGPTRTHCLHCVYLKQFYLFFKNTSPWYESISTVYECCFFCFSGQ